MTYAYACPACGSVFECEQAITAEPLREPCPVCLAELGQKVVMRRVVTGGNGFRLKGDGWTSKGRT